MLVLLDIESIANRGSKEIARIVEGVLAERQWEHADVLKVDHPDTMVCVDEEVVPLDVGVIPHRLITKQ